MMMMSSYIIPRARPAPNPPRWLTCPRKHSLTRTHTHTRVRRLALKAAGGASGFPVTIGFLQMALGSAYALFLWAAPDARTLPTVDFQDILKILPVAACAAGAHLSSIFSMNLGAVSFAQIVK